MIKWYLQETTLFDVPTANCVVRHKFTNVVSYDKKLEQFLILPDDIGRRQHCQVDI
jgi:hypothetical protein